MSRFIIFVVTILQVICVLSAIWQLVGFPSYFNLIMNSPLPTERLWVAVAIKTIVMLVSLGALWGFQILKGKVRNKIKDAELQKSMIKADFLESKCKDNRNSFFIDKAKNMHGLVSFFGFKGAKVLMLSVYLAVLGRIFVYVPWVANISYNSRYASLDQGYSLLWEPPINYATVDMGRVFLSALAATVVFGIIIILIFYAEKCIKRKGQ